MEKDQNKNINENLESNEIRENSEDVKDTNSKSDSEVENKDKDKVEKTPEEKILELEDKITRTFAEMENQRRRFEKEKEEAFEYGGFAFAKEALNLIDNLDRSKHVLENDDELKETKALKKTLEHLNIIKNVQN